MTDARYNLVLGVMMSLGAVLLLLAARPFPERATYLPNTVGYLLLASGLALIVLTIVDVRTNGKDGPRTFFEGFNAPLWLITVLALLGFYAGMPRIGFYESVLVFAAAVTFVLSVGTAGWRAALWQAAAFAAMLTGTMYGLFTVVLNVPIRGGLLL